MPKIIPVATFDCVVFGATGDLTLRKLLPALYYRFRDGQMPPESRIIAAARSDLDDEAYRKRASKALREHVAREDLDSDTADRFCRRAQLRPAGRDGCQGGLACARGHARRRARACLLSRHVARSLRSDLSQHRCARPGHRAVARRAGEADRSRPRLGARDQRPGRRRVQRDADLPHRPLPRQGDGAEPARAPLRQHDLRAAVECRCDRPRADHGRRDGRRGAARRLLRPLGRAARHGAEPHAAAAVPGRDGTAGVAGSRSGARREAEGAARAASVRTARGADPDGARPVHRRARSTASRCPATSPISTVPKAARPRPSSR